MIQDTLGIWFEDKLTAALSQFLPTFSTVNTRSHTLQFTDRQQGRTVSQLPLSAP